jgi:hypothetical protein
MESERRAVLFDGDSPVGSIDRVGPEGWNISYASEGPSIGPRPLGRFRTVERALMRFSKPSPQN